jgi:hypothetical protein
MIAPPFLFSIFSASNSPHSVSFARKKRKRGNFGEFASVFEPRLGVSAYHLDALQQ